MKTENKSRRAKEAPDGSTENSIQEKQVMEERRCQVEDLENNAREKATKTSSEIKRPHSWYAGAFVLGNIDMPIELAYKAARLSHNERDLFFYIFQALSDSGSDEPLLLIPHKIESSTGMSKRQQQKARASLMMQDLIRCKDEGNGWVYCYITWGHIDEHI